MQSDKLPSIILGPTFEEALKAFNLQLEQARENLVYFGDRVVDYTLSRRERLAKIESESSPPATPLLTWLRKTNAYLTFMKRLRPLSQSHDECRKEMAALCAGYKELKKEYGVELEMKKRTEKNIDGLLEFLLEIEKNLALLPQTTHDAFETEALPNLGGG